MIQDDDRSAETKRAFIKYLEEHPQERFWQAVRNFSNYDFILGSNSPSPKTDDWAEVHDTFYREQK